jgi:CcmD family protein
MTFQNVPATAPPTAPAPNTPDDRATQFQAVEGGETYKGETLLVTAYAFIWLLLMGWIFLLWRKQQSLTMRLDGLEAAIDRATAAKEGKSENKNERKKVTV